jgi:hypothetical protein
MMRQSRGVVRDGGRVTAATRDGVGVVKGKGRAQQPVRYGPDPTRCAQQAGPNRLCATGRAQRPVRYGPDPTGCAQQAGLGRPGPMGRPLERRLRRRLPASDASAKGHAGGTGTPMALLMASGLARLDRISPLSPPNQGIILLPGAGLADSISFRHEAQNVIAQAASGRPSPAAKRRPLSGASQLGLTG